MVSEVYAKRLLDRRICTGFAIALERGVSLRDDELSMDFGWTNGHHFEGKFEPCTGTGRLAAP